MINEILEYLDRKELRYRLEDGKNGKEIVVQTCPFCRNPNYHFYINSQTGFFQCFVCPETGTFLTLKRHLGDVLNVVSTMDLAGVPTTELPTEEEWTKINEAHEALLCNKGALRYLAKRRFTQEAIEFFHLGYSVEDSVEWLWYPYIRKGRVVNVKKRTIPPFPKGFKRWKGKESDLLNGDILDGKLDSVFLCEGESDAVSLWGMGVKNCVGVSVGAGGINNAWIDLLDKVPKIYFVYDQDDAGVQGAYKFANRLGIERCFKVCLPTGVNDVNDFFTKGHTLEEFNTLVDKARPFDVEFVSSIGDEISRGIQRLYNTGGEAPGLELPWPKLDRLINKLVPGDLVVIASRPGMGKSQMGINMIYHYGMHGIPSLLFSLEMPPQRLMPRFVARHTRTNSKQIYTMEALGKAYHDLKDAPLYFAYVYKKPTYDVCADTIRSCVRRYGIQFLVFDNLHFLVRSITDQVREVSLITQSFKLLAEELGIPMVLIARPRKGANKIITNMDLKDSADVEADADIVILIHREKKGGEEGSDYPKFGEHEGVFEEKTLVIVSKCRYAAGGQTYLRSIDAECRIEEY